LSSLICLDFQSGSDVTPCLFAAHLDVKYPGHGAVYCDGSHLINDPSVACGLYFPFVGQAVPWQLHPHHSVLSAELIAILQALRLIETDSFLQWVICSDSLVAMQLLLSPTNTCSDLVYGIHELLIQLNDSKIMHLQWVKAHIGIIGSERADAVAKLHQPQMAELPNCTSLVYLAQMFLLVFGHTFFIFGNWIGLLQWLLMEGAII
jgi:ribonuclease HI